MSEDNLTSAVSEELFKRLKKAVNSKRSTFKVHIQSCEYVGRWQNLEVKGVAHLTGFEDYYNIDFMLRNNDARDFLKDAKLEMPKKIEVVE